MKFFDYAQKVLSLQYDAMNAALAGTSKFVELVQQQVAEAERIGKRAVEAK